MRRHDATADARASPATGTKGGSAARWMVAAVVVGLAIGMLFPDRAGASGFRASDLAVVATLFLRMVKALVAPLVFATLVVGIAGHGAQNRGVGLLAVRSIVYFEIVTTIALVLGLVAGNVVRPGHGVTLSIAAAHG